MASKYQSKLIKQYESEGYYVIVMSKTNKNGMTDLQCIKDGKSVFIESKEANDTLKELQKFRINELRNAGCEAFCIKDGSGRIY